ncbi:MAG: hypothetical protein DRP32_05210 [Thermotogae bacterium]|nr:MAG: hypothetical protein DRP32_05210 [Thermotogota bacterium]
MGIRVEFTEDLSGEDVPVAPSERLVEMVRQLLQVLFILPVGHEQRIVFKSGLDELGTVSFFLID